MKCLIFALLIATPTLFAQNAVWADLRGEWRITYEDRPEFDDRAGQTIQVPLGERYLRQPNHRWFRRRVTLPPGANRLPLALTLGALQGVQKDPQISRRRQQVCLFDQESHIPQDRRCLSNRAAIDRTVRGTA